jgi:hypothetical protein
MISFLRHKKFIFMIGVVIMVFITWFACMSTMTAKTKWMTNKVETSLDLGIQLVERDAPRILVTNDGGYYVPDANAVLPSNIPSWSKVYEVLLENLNQDISVPLCKVTKVTLFNGTSEIAAYATLQFEVIPGITKVIAVTKTKPFPHYKNPIGDALVN